MSTVDAIVEAGRRRSLRSALRELWAFRDTARAFAERDLRVKHDWQPVAVFRVGEAPEQAAGPASQTNLALEGPIHVSHDWEVA